MDYTFILIGIGLVLSGALIAAAPAYRAGQIDGLKNKPAKLYVRTRR